MGETCAPRCASRGLVGEGEREHVLDHLNRLRPASGEAPGPFEGAVRSLHTQADWMGNAQTGEEQGYPVGRGLVVRAVAVVIKRRRKKRGMRWKRSNATSVVA
jgi:hypothetical protein